MVALHSDKTHLISYNSYYMCVHMWPFAMKFNMLGFFILLYHVHFKEDYMRKICFITSK